MWEHASVNMFTLLRNTACVKQRGRTLSEPWRWLTLPWHHRLLASAGLPPAVVRKQFVHSPAEGAEALMGLPGAWPNQHGTSQGLGSHPDSPPVAGARCFLQAAYEGCIAQTSKGPLREARSGTCLGMPGQGKGP